MFSFPLFERIKAATPEFEQLTAFQAGGARMSVRRESVEASARPLRSEFVTGNYFSTLGVGAFGGRVLTAADDTPSAAPAAVLSHHVWQGAYGGDPSIVGATFFVEGRPFTVVGVTPPGFFGETLRGDPPDLWIPLQQEPLINGDTSILRQPISAWLRVIGRLRPGATTDGMGPRLTGILHQWIQHESGYPANWMPAIVQALPKQVITVVPAGAGVGVMKEQYGRSLQLLLGVCGLVLLIACANVANLLLARAVARRGQTAVRLAMGASRRQIVTQALVESTLLAVAGGIAGLVVAFGAARLMLALPSQARRFCRSTRVRRRWSSRSRSASRSSPGSCSALRRRGWRRAPIRSTRFAARDAAPAITRRSRAGRCWSCRRPCPLCSSPDRRCSRGVSVISKARTSASNCQGASSWR